MRAAGFEALMSGEGADELFGGYPYFGLEAIWRMGADESGPALRAFAEAEGASRGICGRTCAFACAVRPTAAQTTCASAWGR